MFEANPLLTITRLLLFYDFIRALFFASRRGECPWRRSMYQLVEALIALIFFRGVDDGE